MHWEREGVVGRIYGIYNMSPEEDEGMNQETKRCCCSPVIRIFRSPNASIDVWLEPLSKTPDFFFFSIPNLAMRTAGYDTGRMGLLDFFSGPGWRRRSRAVANCP